MKPDECEATAVVSVSMRSGVVIRSGRALFCSRSSIAPLCCVTCSTYTRAHAASLNGTMLAHVAVTDFPDRDRRALCTGQGGVVVTGAHHVEVIDGVAHADLVELGEEQLAAERAVHLVQRHTQQLLRCRERACSQPHPSRTVEVMDLLAGRQHEHGLKA